MDKPETTKAVDAKEDKASGPTPSHMQSPKNSTVIVLAIGAIVVVGGFGLSVALLGRNFIAQRMHGQILAAPQSMPFEHRGGLRRFAGDSINPTSGTHYTRLSGVVTQVNGSTFVIAGNGTTKTVTTNSSTTYSNGFTKVSVNDSVMVLGTDQNSTFTASRVRIINE